MEVGVYKHPARWRQRCWLNDHRFEKLLFPYSVAFFLTLGLKESTTMSHADSLLLAELEDEVRRQVGVVYSQDSQ